MRTPAAGRDEGPAARNGLVPWLLIAGVLLAAYAGWEALGRRPRPEPFGPWSDADQVAPDPPALAPAVGQVGPTVFDDGEDEAGGEP